MRPTRISTFSKSAYSIIHRSPGRVAGATAPQYTGAPRTPAPCEEFMQAPLLEVMVGNINAVGEAEIRAIVSEQRAADAAAWLAPTACSEWTARDIVAHLAAAGIQFLALSR